MCSFCSGTQTAGGEAQTRPSGLHRYSCPLDFLLCRGRCGGSALNSSCMVMFSFVSRVWNLCDASDISCQLWRFCDELASLTLNIFTRGSQLRFSVSLCKCTQESASIIKVVTGEVTEVVRAQCFRLTVTLTSWYSLNDPRGADSSSFCVTFCASSNYTAPFCWCC